MARMNQEYDQGAAPDHSHADAYELMPAGDYVAQIVETDIKPNKKNTGDILSTTLEILAPVEYKGRKVWNRINVSNQSAEAQRIGQVELANMKEGLGMTGVRIDDTVQFHNIPVGVKLAIELGDGQYKDKNVVKDFFTANLFGSPERAAKAAAVIPSRPVTRAAPPTATQYTPPQQPAQPAFVPPAQPPAQAYAQPTFVAPQVSQQPNFSAAAPGTAGASAPAGKPAWMTRTANGAAVTA